MAAIALAAVTLAPNAWAQAPEVQRARPAATPAAAPADARFVIQVYSEKVTVYADATTRSAVVAELQQGTRVEGNARRGTWYRVSLSDGRTGWINRVEGKVGPNFAVDTTPGVMLARPTAPAAPAGGEAPAAAAAPSGPIPDDRRRAAAPDGPAARADHSDHRSFAGAAAVAALPNETVPIPDRWRLTDQLNLVNMRWFDPYNRNTLQGATGRCSDDWFFNLRGDLGHRRRGAPAAHAGRRAVARERAAVRSTCSARASSRRSSRTLIALVRRCIKGDTDFKPPEYEFRFMPVFNVNYAKVEEVRGAATSTRATGRRARDNFVGLQEAFVDKHLRNVSDRYDFDSVRVGIQPFIADFRGFLFQDNPLGVRLFGNARQQPVAVQPRAGSGASRRTPTAGLNDLGQPLRDDDIFVANLYWQDFPVPGFTLAGHRALQPQPREPRTSYYDENGFHRAARVARRRCARATTTSATSATTATATSAA